MYIKCSALIAKALGAMPITVGAYRVGDRTPQYVIPDNHFVLVTGESEIWVWPVVPEEKIDGGEDALG